MREIKFRAWDNVKDEMYYVGEEGNISFGLESNGIIAYDITEEEEEFKVLHHLQYMQYTGVEDARGYEIYEGDILRIVSNFELRKDVQNQVVEYREGYFHTFEWTLFELLRNRKVEKQTFEVIGNIYENPELLKRGE